MAEKWALELKDTKTVDAVKVDTKKNLADMMTKCLSHAVRSSLEAQIVTIAKTVAKQGYLGGTLD